MLRQSFVKLPSVKLDSEPLTVPALDVGVTPEDRATLAVEKSRKKLLLPVAKAAISLSFFGVNCEPFVPNVNCPKKLEIVKSPP